MKVTTENTNTREVTLTIEPDADRMAQAKRRAASTLSRYRPVPGFRPGRAPVPMVERIFGADTVLQEAVHTVAEELFREAVAEADLRPLSAGEMEVESSDPIRLKVTVSLVPTVELGDYRSLHVDPEPEATVDEAQVDAEIEALPEVNDELAKDVSDHETLDELRQSIRDRIHEEQEAARKQRETEAALKALIDHATIEYPTAAVDQEVDAMIRNEQSRVQGYGWDWAAYLRLTRKTEEQLRSEIRPRAEERLVRALALSEFALREGLNVEPAEVDAEVDRILEQYGDRSEEVQESLRAAVRPSVENDTLSRKTVEHLVAAVAGREEFLAPEPEEVEEETEETPEEQGAAADQEPENAAAEEGADSEPAVEETPDAEASPEGEEPQA